MWSVKPSMDVQLKKPAIKLIGLAKDKNCQATMSHEKQKECEYKDSKSQSTVKYVFSDKKCQENIRPRKPRSDMQSVTNNSNETNAVSCIMCSGTDENENQTSSQEVTSFTNKDIKSSKF